MKKNALIYLVISFLLIFSSCKKNDNTDPAPTPAIKADTLGAGWSKITLSNEFLVDIFFQNNVVGYTLGKGLYKSVDGGNTWTKLPTSFGSGANLAVTADGKIFVAGNSNIIYRSTDGGLTFVPVNTNVGQVNDVIFIDNSTGYVAFSGGLLQTLDGGITWIAVTPLAGLTISGAVYQTAGFINSTTGWIASGGEIFKNNGTIHTWIKSSFTGLAPTGNGISLFPVTDLVIYAGCNDGKVYKSVDGGLNFYTVYNFNEVTGFNDIHFIDVNTGYASCGNRIYKTTNGGVTWQVVVALGESIFSEIHFTDANHGWGCTNDGSILKLN